MTTMTDSRAVEVVQRLRGVLQHAKMGSSYLISQDLIHKAIDAITAPPSAPVGVEGLVERMRQAPFTLWSADLIGQQISVERMRNILAFALAQQPAAEERGAYYVCPVCHGPGRVTRETHDRYQQPAAVDGAARQHAAVLARQLRWSTTSKRMRAALNAAITALAAQPGGSDNDR